MYKENIHILLCELIILLTTILGWSFLRSRILFGLSIIIVMGIVFTVFFFRNPERIIPEGYGVVVSPADGRITDVKQVTDLSICESSFNMVSIFLTLWDVHVNRTPISGKVVLVKYSPGRFLPAFIGKSSRRNEQNLIGINGEIGRVFIKQIAGFIARRIVCRLRIGDRIDRGERFGMIRFGSRVELYLPTSIKIEVARGQRIKGGISIIGRLDEV